MVIVTTSYSHDSQVMARIFDDEATASEFIRRDYFNERKISQTENSDYEEIIEEESYCDEYGAKMVYESYGEENYIQWAIADIADLRGMKIEDKFPSLKAD